MQLVVDRILRAVHPFTPKRREKILTIVQNYLDADLEDDENDDPEDDEDVITDDMDTSPAERRAPHPADGPSAIADVADRIVGR